MRSLLLLALLFSAGCSAGGLVESADAKAVREYWREKDGDGSPSEIIKVHRGGTAKDFLAGYSKMEPIDDDGRCVPVTVRGNSILGMHDFTYLYVIQDGKVAKTYMKYKRK